MFLPKTLDIKSIEMNKRNLQLDEKQPDYRKIYLDILHKKYPEKEEECKEILSKKVITFLEVIRLNDIIFKQDKNENLRINQNLRSYDLETAKEILVYQRKNGMNNSEIARKFRMSRNTIASWRKKICI